MVLSMTNYGAHNLNLLNYLLKNWVTYFILYKSIIWYYYELHAATAGSLFLRKIILPEVHKIYWLPVIWIINKERR